MLFFQIFIYAIASLVILLTVLPFLKFGVWWIRIGDFPRLQIGFASLATVAGLLFVSKYSFHALHIITSLLMLLCAAYQFYRVLPYTRFYRKQVELCREPRPDKIIGLLIYNVLIKNRKTTEFLRLVEKENPDLILLAEPDEFWLNEIAALEKNYPFGVKYPLDNAYGMALYSRLELENPQLKFLVEDDIPSIHTDIKLPSGDLARLYCLHPRPPIPPENDRSTERDAELILVGRTIKDTDVPTIVAGDLNDVAWSRTTNLFQKISGLLDPRIGRGLYSSFHADYPFIRFPLDHVFHTNHFRLVRLKRLPHIGSDHFPIYISLSYERTAELTQEEPEATAEEEQESIEILEEAAEILQEERENEERAATDAVGAHEVRDERMRDE
jgi:endonuclease/exonuclease/phosphatase (EEP) superfamily protein YafD